MRRTVLSALALACTAVLASTVPAFADGTSPTPAPASVKPTAEPTEAAPAPAGSKPVTEPSTAPTKAPSDGEVSVVPSGAPDTGEVSTGSQSGGDAGLIGTGAAAAFTLGGAAVYVVRRRRATGA
ncbi:MULTISPECIES: Tat pathway signal sequence domain protein [Streptomyces]|uniref:Tat pathway signal sequence domain protein n=1 Tax=Streptomyces sp. LRE541 TaxID=2931983 RepID=UPI00200EBF78|nr:Tat pathway signal sequence domain protein [Streptomyces sp. LRE541]UPZ30615.1 Tat pathway signal sequence domain protein [Streptomyces sp. LRE541]